MPPMLLIRKIGLTAIGDVLIGKAEGRSSAEEITIFDSSGISLQDLCMGQKLLKFLRPDCA
jgi:ornithine cyclodeaminase